MHEYVHIERHELKTPAKPLAQQLPANYPSSSTIHSLPHKETITYPESSTLQPIYYT